jgi:hypothetical protein
MQNEQSGAMKELEAGINREISSILGDNQNDISGTNGDTAATMSVGGFFEGLSEKAKSFIDANPELIEALSKSSVYCG